jgi:uncharacterized protein (TIGR03067 family)
MRPLISLAVVAALVGHSAAKAPVPKAPPPQSIDGKYTLQATSSGAAERPAGKGLAPADPGNPWGTTTRTALLRGETVITKNEITIEPRTAAALPTTMEYTLDPSKSPMTIDVENVPIRGKRTRQLGVAEVSGNRLVIALAKEGADRPKTTDEAEGVTVYYFQKAPPPPKVEFRIVVMTVGKEADAEKELNQLAKDGYELVSTGAPLAADGKSSPTTIHFVLKRVSK